ncbi:MAG: hypothetical protein B6229_01990 [Spirochaetaceae bacterium 4572_7]|nr:MAG: hypothetical protein B6229_01990 [Spirochaetaceae bacterium 4572_7]
MKKTTLLLFIYFLGIATYAKSPFLIEKEEVSIISLSENEYYNSTYYNSELPFETGLEIYAQPSKAKITLNGQKYNSNYKSFNLIEPGDYYLKITSSDYVTYSHWITIEADRRVIIDAQLSRKYGFINVTSNTPNTQIYLNEFEINNYEPIPTGPYVMIIKSFGYIEYSQPVLIIDKFVSNIDVTLKKAPFELESISSNKKVFNPYANENFSNIKFYINVNGPGSGELSIINTNKETVFTKNLIFTDWITSIDNKGVDNLGVKLPDGLYDVVVKSKELEQRLTMNIDSTLIQRLLPSSRGFTGLMFSPTAEMNREPITTTSFGLFTSSKDHSLKMPFDFSTTITQNLGVHLGLNFDLDFNTNNSLVELYTGIILSKDLGSIILGFNLNYSFESDISSEDTILSHKIIGNTPITINLKPIFLSISPEINYSLSNNFILGFGAGVHYDNQKIRTGISGRSDYIESSWGKIQYAGEFFHLIPKSQSYLGIRLSKNSVSNISLGILFSVLY